MKLIAGAVLFEPVKVDILYIHNSTCCIGYLRLQSVKMYLSPFLRKRNCRYRRHRTVSPPMPRFFSMRTPGKRSMLSKNKVSLV